MAKSISILAGIGDEKLIELYKNSDDLSYTGELYGRYMHLVYGVCLKYLKNREDAKDAVMQIFERLITDLKKHPIKNFKSWLYVIAKNRCLMQLRARKNIHEMPLEDNDLLHSGVEFDTGSHLNNETDLENNLNLLEKGIKQLPDEQKQCVDLFYLKKKSYREITDLTGFDLKKVKSSIQNGKRNLKIYMEKRHE